MLFIMVQCFHKDIILHIKIVFQRIQILIQMFKVIHIYYLHVMESIVSTSILHTYHLCILFFVTFKSPLIYRVELFYK